LRKYETIFVIDSLLKPEEIEGIIAKYERFISDNGGAIEYIDKIGKKRLAYEIKKRQYGYYVLIRFDGPPTMIKQLEREYRLNESLLRFMTIKLDKHALMAMEKAGGYSKRPAQEEESALFDNQGSDDVFEQEDMVVKEEDFEEEQPLSAGETEVNESEEYKAEEEE
jgi:small subunit ribosomal protein S6